VIVTAEGVCCQRQQNRSSRRCRAIVLCVNLSASRSVACEAAARLYALTTLSQWSVICRRRPMRR